MGDPIFPLSLSSYPQIIERVDPSVLSPLYGEVIQTLRRFHSQESTTLINRDHEDGDGVEVYLGMKEHLFCPYLVFTAFAS